MARALKVCTGLPGKRCPELVASGRCPECTAEAGARRGTAAQRGYTSPGHKRFRETVLRRDPFCVCPDQHHGHGHPCGAISTVADHYPFSRRDLILQHHNPDDPAAGRALCKGCHDKATSQHQPGGWAAR